MKTFIREFNHKRQLKSVYKGMAKLDKKAEGSVERTAKVVMMKRRFNDRLRESLHDPAVTPKVASAVVHMIESNEAYIQRVTGTAEGELYKRFAEAELTAFEEEQDIRMLLYKQGLR